MEYVDRNVTAFLTLTSANRWLGLRLDSLGALIVSSTAFACIAKSDLSPGLAGLSLSYALQFVQYVSFTIRAIADAEMQMNRYGYEAVRAHKRVCPSRSWCMSFGKQARRSKLYPAVPDFCGSLRCRYGPQQPSGPSSTL